MYETISKFIKGRDTPNDNHIGKQDFCYAGCFSENSSKLVEILERYWAFKISKTPLWKSPFL